MSQSPLDAGTHRLCTWLEASWGPCARWQWLSLICLTLLLYTFRLGSARILTDHEIYAAGPARQMALEHDWLTPRMGHDLWLEKPPLTHWLINLSALLCGGFDQTSVRLPSAFAGIATVLLITWIAARLFDSSIGYVAGLLQATSVFMLQAARQAVADMQLCFLVLAAVALFVHLHLCGGFEKRIARACVLIFWLLVGLTNLSKGPLFGATLVLFTCGGWLLMQRNWRDLRRIISPLGILAAVAMGVAWPVLMGLKHPEAWDLWRMHLFGRFQGTDLQYTAQPFWYYIPSAAYQWLPWTPLVLVGCGTALPDAWRWQYSPNRFLLWWFLGQFMLLSCAAGKGHYYLIYALPALAPIAAQGVQRISAWSAASSNLSRLAWVGLILWLVAAVSAPAVIPRLLVSIPPGLIGLITLLAMLGLAGSVAMLRRQMRWSRAATYAMVFVGELYTVGWIMSYRDPSAADIEFLAGVDRRLSPDDLLIGTDFIGMPRYLFYLNHHVEGYLEPDKVPELPTGRDSAYILARACQADSLEHLGRLEIVAQSQRTRAETRPQDRYTLFRVQTMHTAQAGDPSPQR